MSHSIFHKQHEHCSYCGGLFLESKFPKTCLICNNITYLNPLPVSVTLISVLKDNKPTCQPGILLVRRAIEPKYGEWALPGGYLEASETWQAGAAREVKEEVGLELDSKKINLLDVKTADNGNLLIFSKYDDIIYWDDINFVPNREVSEIIISYGMEDLAFPTHTAVINKFYHLND